MLFEDLRKSVDDSDEMSKQTMGTVLSKVVQPLVHVHPEMRNLVRNQRMR